ncbi:MAG TPA: hypothetical protein VGG75_16060 [Trebonia sp.]
MKITHTPAPVAVIVSHQARAAAACLVEEFGAEGAAEVIARCQPGNRLAEQLGEVLAENAGGDR